MTFPDRLHAAIHDKRSVVCVGIDPNYFRLPDAVVPGERNANDAASVVDAFFAFTLGVLDAVAEYAAAVKFQSAYFEQYHAEGVEAYFSLIHEAKSRGLIVIGDAKRGDIGATSEAYAAAHLAPLAGEDVETPDALTVNPMLGLDTIEPFVDTAADEDKGLFVLVRTSNPGSAALQDVNLADGRTWSEALADQLAEVADRPALRGRCGWSALGAVVGATQPEQMTSLRRRLPKSPLLLPGYGAQGATAEMTRAAFENNAPALVSASRSVLYADGDGDWQQNIATAAKAMRDDLHRTLA
ncbi:MAG: orotidine-5'-phosphate decarboxylase [Planctomycetota bacterium]